MVASLDRFIYIYINFIFIYNGLGLCFGSHLVFEPFENRTIRKPDQGRPFENRTCPDFGYPL